MNKIWNACSTRPSCFIISFHNSCKIDRRQMWVCLHKASVLQTVFACLHHSNQLTPAEVWGTKLIHTKVYNSSQFRNVFKKSTHPYIQTCWVLPPSLSHNTSSPSHPSVHTKLDICPDQFEPHQELYLSVVGWPWLRSCVCPSVYCFCRADGWSPMTICNK